MATREQTRGLPFRISSRFILFVIALTLSACADTGCDCEGFETAQYPEEHYDKTVPLGGQVRVTDSGLQFLGDQVPTLIEQVQPGGLSFCLPPTNDTVDICTNSTCADGSDGCQLDLAISESSLTPEPADKLNVGITIGEVGGQNSDDSWNDEIDVRALGSDCLIRISEPGDSNAPGELEATIPITFSIDQQSPTNDVKIDIGDPQVEDILNQVEVDLDGKDWWDTPVCETADAAKGLFGDTINDQLTGFLNETIAELEAENLCRTCGDQQPACPGNSTCGEQAGVQVCKYQDDTCVPAKLGIEGNLKLGSVIGDFSENPTAGVHTMANLADKADVDTGLNLALRTGFQQENSARCIPIDPTARPSFDAIGASDSIYTDQRGSGDSFMVGIGVHKRAVEHALWSTWASGALCLQVSGADISELNPNTLGLLLPSIKELTSSNALLFLKIVPQTAPKVQLGANTVTESGDTYEIQDPLLTLDWKDLDIHFYAYSQDRFLRLFSLRADVTVPVALAADGQGSIIPVLGDLDDAVDNIRPMKTELLAEDPQRLVDLVPTLISQALPSLAGSLNEPIELPEFFGLAIGLDQEDITSVDNNTMIALFADLVEVSQTNFMATLDTSIVDTRVDTSEWTDSGIPQPKVVVDVFASTPIDNVGTVTRDVEFSYRVDGGSWSLFHRTDRLIIQDPALVLQGHHSIDVRARWRGAPGTAETDYATVDVPVDYQAPELSIERSGAVVSLEASDVVDDELEYRYRIVDDSGGSDWTDWSSQAAVDLAEIDAAERLRFIAQVRDDAGYITEDEQNISWDPNATAHPDEERPVAQHDDKIGCSSSGNSTPVGPFGLMLLLGALGFAALRRRIGGRRVRGRSLIVAIAVIGLLGGTGCKDDDTSGDPWEPGDPCDPVCAEGQQCVENECQDVAECEMDSECGDCADGERAVCNDGSCECRTLCEAGCDEGQFCCYESDMCQDIPDPCADQMCDPGFKPEATSMGTPDSDACQVTGQSCECVTLPPLPLENHGQYASVTQNDSVKAVSVYNKTYGDLMVGLVGDDGTPSWTFVDGVPEDGDIEGALTGPRGGIGDAGPNVGTHTAIAVDSSDTLHVFYRDENAGTLKYARGTSDGSGAYAWETMELDTEGDTGLFTDAIVADGVVHVVYSVQEIDDGSGNWRTQIRHSSFQTDTEMSSIGVEANLIHTADAANPCGTSCDAGQECFLADATCVQQTGDCTDSCGDGTECRNGSCEPIYVEPAGQYPNMVGLFNNLTTTSDGLLLVFHDNRQEVVGWTRWSAGDSTWEDPSFLGSGTGPYASGMVDADGNVHLAYMDTENQALVYQQVGGSGEETIISGVRDTAEAYLVADIGEDVHLRVKSDGTPQVLFQDATWHKLHVASRSNSGDWTVDTLAEPGDPYTGAHGLYIDVVQSPSDSSFAVEYVIDNQAEPTTATPEFPSAP
jgi:MYXO-CTERM domain-containing protein